MATFHYVHLRAFAHLTEDPEKVRRAVGNVAQGAPLELEETVVEGSHGNRILILEAEVRSAPAQKALFRALARDDPEGFARLRSEVEKRVDEHLNFYVRLDKQEACLGRLRLTASDDAITVRAKIRSFKQAGGDATQALQSLGTFLDALTHG